MADLDLRILKATVLVGRPGTDYVSLTTDLPSPFPPEVDEGPLIVKFEVRKGDGVSYVCEHFSGFPIEVIDCSNGSRHTIEE